MTAPGTGAAKRDAGSIGRKPGFAGSTTADSSSDPIEPSARGPGALARAVAVDDNDTPDERSFKMLSTVARRRRPRRLQNLSHSFDLRQYARELLSGNVGLGRLLGVAVRATQHQRRRRLGFLGDVPPTHESRAAADPELSGEESGMQPGDVVQIRSRERDRSNAR